jgi:hypothetical protein
LCPEAIADECDLLCGERIVTNERPPSYTEKLGHAPKRRLVTGTVSNQWIGGIRVGYIF